MQFHKNILLLLIWLNFSQIAASFFSFSSTSNIQSHSTFVPAADEIELSISNLNDNRIVYDGKTLKIMQKPEGKRELIGAAIVGGSFALAQILLQNKHITAACLTYFYIGLLLDHLIINRLRKKSYNFDETGVSVNDKRLCTWAQVSRAKVITVQEDEAMGQ